MAPRSIWNGTVCLGNLRIPVKLYSATEPQSIHFHEVHLKDRSRIEHRRICTAEEVEVDYSEIVKGYELDNGKYVILEKDEIKAAAGDRGKVIELKEFVNSSDIDPVFVARTYFVGPRDEPETWALLQEALSRSGRAGIGRFSFHNREYLAAVRCRENLIALETLRFHDEVLKSSELKVKAAKKKPTKSEEKMADQLIAGLDVEFNPGDYRDQHREEIMEMISAKAEDHELPQRKSAEPGTGRDLSEQLKASLADLKTKAG